MISILLATLLFTIGMILNIDMRNRKEIAENERAINEGSNND